MNKKRFLTILITIVCGIVCFFSTRSLMMEDRVGDVNLYTLAWTIVSAFGLAAGLLIIWPQPLQETSPRSENLTPDPYKIDSYTRFLIFLARREQLKTELVITERAIKEYEAEEKEKEFEMEKDLNEGKPLPE